MREKGIRKESEREIEGKRRRIDEAAEREIEKRNKVGTIGRGRQRQRRSRE